MDNLILNSFKVDQKNRRMQLISSLPLVPPHLAGDRLAMENAQRGEAKARFFRPELDVVRLLAFSLVFVCHLIPGDPLRWRFLSNLRDGASFGVCLFFFLSAFLITELLIREREATGTVHIRSFYIRRILRIWPLYFLSLFIAFVLPRLTHAYPPMTVPTLLAYLLLAGNWARSLLPYGFGVLWSISVEEQFYLVWPTLIWLTKKRALPFLCVGIWCISQVVVVALYKQGQSGNAIWCNTFVQAQYFALGGTLSILLRGRVPKLSLIPRILMVSAGIATFILLPGRGSVPQYFPYLAAGPGSALILLGFLGAKIPRHLQILQYLGKISYGLYIIHENVLVEVSRVAPLILHRQHGIYVYKVLIGLPITIALAHLSYKYFEKPFLRLKERFEVVRSREA